MRVTIFGSGYVGLVTGACLAEAGNHIVCVDVDDSKISALNDGQVPLYEPGLEDLIRRNTIAGRLQFTTDAGEGVDHGLFQFIAVGTPPDENGSADLKHVLEVADSIARNLKEYRIIVDKSTVPVGTADRVRATIQSVLDDRGESIEFDVVSNPEFLKEGAAIEDFMKPNRIVVGTDNPRTTELLKSLYEPFNRNHDRLIAMDIRSAELTKYAANAMLATKISFMNELANMAERFGADIEAVRIGIGSDPLIGYQFIYPGCGYGGSCFPKDIQALAQAGESVGYTPELLQAVESVNKRQKKVLFEKIRRHYGSDLAGKRLAVWGLAFKPDTDDMREASSRVLIEALKEAKVHVRAYDPEAMNEARRVLGTDGGIEYCDQPMDTLDNADALVIVTEWREFRSPDFDQIKSLLKQPVVFDGRNIFDPALMARLGFTYYGIGRGMSIDVKRET